MTVIVRVPPFVDFEAARRYPVIVPPAPIADRLLPPGAVVTLSNSGACTIEVAS